MIRPRRLAAAVFALPAVVLFAGCASNPPSPAAPSTAAAGPQQYAAGYPSQPGQPAPVPGMLADAPADDLPGQIAALGAAEAALNQMLGDRGGMGQKKEIEAGAGGPPKPAATASPKAGAPAAGDYAADPCSMACTALASMGRAADHLCALAGDGDSRCDDARTRVRSATERVRASCPACSAGSLERKR